TESRERDNQEATSTSKAGCSGRRFLVWVDGCVGKTSLLHAFCERRFQEHHEPTVFENYISTVVVNKKEVQISLWDTAGQEDLDRLRPLCYNDADVILICFSLWRPEIHHYCPTIPTILVGTKSDLRKVEKSREFLLKYGQGAIQTEEGKAMATRIAADSYCECSAKSFEGVDDVFQAAATAALKVSTTKY
ncbi:Ras-like GTP-binding protein RHO, partial [Orchesella cincta]